MSDLQEIIATQSIKAYNQGFNDAIDKDAQILKAYEDGILKLSAKALQEGIKAERKRILSFITDPKLIAAINEDSPCEDCQGNCCG
jgi:arginine decarboxylase-like protein